MNFIEMRDLLMEHFTEMVKNVDYLYEVHLDKDELYNLYLDSFPEGTNEIYRERREHDCSCCRGFIKSIGNVVSIKNGKVETIWDFKTNDTTYQPVLDALSNYVKSFKIKDIYKSIETKLGCHHNFEFLENGEQQQWDHFYLELPSRFVIHDGRSKGDILGDFRDTRNVFKRSLDEISLEAIDTILELINSNTLYRGEEWRSALIGFRQLKKDYDSLTTDDERELYAWEQSVKTGITIGRIRNHSIGVLLINVSEDMDLDLAVKKYEQIVAPSNYKRPKAIYTKKMLEDAKKTIEELGYANSLRRRFATIDDITVNNILFSNKDVVKKIDNSDDIFAEMEKNVVTNPKKFSRVEEVFVKDFVDNILPTAKEVEVFVENRHEKNMCSLIAPVDPDAKTMFKWNNGLSWAYTGNITDSEMKQNIKAAGGDVDGVLRFSIQWNESGTDNFDLDAHAIEPNGNEIYYSNCRKPAMSSYTGQLDVDIIDPSGQIAVENIIWKDIAQMKPGKYSLFVHQYSGSVKNGFRAEVEFNGEIHSFNYPNSMRAKEKVHVAEVTLKEDGTFEIRNIIESNGSKINSKEFWGITTNQFTPVSVICYSPNYFDEQEGTGHRHLMFMLKNCLNPEKPNGYYNEYLKNELAEHKRVFEALGSKCCVEDSENQLSGIGFSMTKRDEIIVKVKGSVERIIKVKF